MAIPTLAELSAELISRVEVLPQFLDRGFSIYNMEDLESLLALSGGLPVVGVAYDGGEPVENNVKSSQTSASRSATLFKIHFAVIIAITYSGAGEYNESTDSKVIATDLLDAARSTLLGYKGINTRPWFLVNEAPLDSELENVIFYGQLWETFIPVVGISE